MADIANAQLKLMGAIAGSAESEQEDAPLTRQSFEDRDVRGTSSTDVEHWCYFHHEKRPKRERWNQGDARNEQQKMEDDKYVISEHTFSSCVRRHHQRKFQAWFERPESDSHQVAGKRGHNSVQLAVRL